MNNFFDTDEDRKKFAGRLGALSHNVDFMSVIEVLRKYESELATHLRYIEDDVKLRHLQGRAQVLGELLEYCDQAKAGQF